MSAAVVIENLPKQSYTLKESLRGIRTNIQFSGDNVKVILITSVTPDEGKSSVSFDLARSFADNGKRVLFVDTDIRKSVHITRMAVKTTDGSAIKGLTHYLSGQSPIDDVMYSTNVPNLYTIFAGPTSPNVTELLDKKYFSNLIKGARSHFDYVIVDTAPITVTIDASLIAKECDGAVLVMVPGENKTNVIRRCIKQLKASNIDILGVILNKFEVSKNSYYGKYYGHEGKK
ncbi:MAG: polysaccharide biosynthesis tyrosine autokinase [Erysipelotrichaceae bacterium]|nr:polysaccharide biosynthesis tyrosine autokinase [Erysipelotrichaceae bacterium]